MKAALRFTSSLILLLCLSVPARSEEKNSEAVQEVKGRMTAVEKDYIAIEGLLASKPVDFPAIQKALDEMETNVKAAQAIGTSARMDKSFKGLMTDIRNFRSQVLRKSVSGMQDALSGLYENCFSCHLTHSAPRASKKTL